MKRILVVTLVTVFFGCPTQKDRPAWPNDKPEVDTLKLRPEVVAVDRAVSNKARVKKDQLRFPADMSAQVATDFPVGKLIVGQAAQDRADQAQNPFGFLRKVKSVAVVDGETVVETENARLDEVLDGQFHKNLDFTAMEPIDLPEGTDLSAYDVPLDTAQGTPFPLMANPADGQPLEGTPTRPSTPAKLMFNQLFKVGKRTDAVTLSQRLAVPERAQSLVNFSNVPFVPVGHPELEVKLSGNIDFTPIVDVTPGITIDYDWNTFKFRLESFEFTAGVNGKLGAKLESTLSIVPKNPNLSAAQYTEALRHFGLIGVKYPIPAVPLGSVSVRGSLGAVPIVARASAFLECTDAYFKGSARLKTQASIGLSPRAGVHYTRADGWEPVLDFPANNPTYSMEVLGNSAALQLDCGAYLRVEILAAGVAGPYAQLRRSLVIDAKREEVCDVSAQKDHQASERSRVDVRMYDALQVGAKVDLIVVEIEKGPYDLARREYKSVPGPPVRNPLYQPNVWWWGPEFIPSTTWEPLWTWEKTRPGVGATRCEVACDDGVKSPGETDVDCGGATCAKCKKGKACAAGGDCGSGTCLPTLTCQGEPCDDDAKGEQETDVDCGGPTCGKCTAGQACSANTDCTSGVCGGNGRCVASLCEDGVKSPNETDVDCGGPTCGACALGKVCGGDADCGQGFCSNDGVTPRTCTENLCRDGRLSGTEGDVDCGASYGCQQLCFDGKGCNADADCLSGVCNLVSHVCVSDRCVDARRDHGETDVDCGGPCQAKCANALGCNFAVNGNADCQSGMCASHGSCVATACENARIDPAEVGLDCAGTCSARCPFNENCNDTADCQSGLICHPLRRRCQLPGCDDAAKNGQETAVDCGGPTCSKCSVSKSCLQDSDCSTGSCFANRCITGPCENGVKDATEADVDCGGTCSGQAKCGLAKSCTANGDCASNICATGRCISDPCLDQVRNAAETDVDCGGGTCAARCAAGKACVTGADCASGTCNAMTLRCGAGPCEDGVKNGAESDLDCGGACATKCAVNKACTADGDCASGVCNAANSRCVPDRCYDGVKNGDETALDCGGSCEVKCGAGQVCVRSVDCQSGACGMGVCATDQCSDGRVNGSESAIDCGGTCAAKCQLGQACAAGADCVHPQNLVGVAGFCESASHTCVGSSCNTGVVDGDETDVDCGGTCATKCAPNRACAVNADCASNICHATLHVCTTTQRFDGIKNGDETDIDCGGATAGKCLEGRGCLHPWDCENGYCGNAGLCLPPIPRTCNDVPASLRVGTGGRFTVDPDGPRKPAANVVSNNPGALSPVTTYCFFPPNERGNGYTPIQYMNSQTLAVPGFSNNLFRQPNPTTYGPAACNTDADCTTNPNDRCRPINATVTTCTTATCMCLSDEPWPENLSPPGLSQAPAGLSVNQSQQRDLVDFRYPIANANQVTGFSHPTVPYRPQTFRIQAFRNGVLMFDSNAITAHDLDDNYIRGAQASPGASMTMMASYATRASDVHYGFEDDGWYFCGDHTATVASMTQPSIWWTPGYGNAGWTPSTPFTPQYGIPAAPYRQSRTGADTVTLAERCNGMFRTPVGRGATTQTYVYSLSRGNPNNDYLRGLWWGSYGGNVGSVPFMGYLESPPAGGFFGICNGMTYTDPSNPAQNNGVVFNAQFNGCSVVPHHLRSQPFQWYPNELTGSQYGSAFEMGVPGLAIVVWAM